MQSFAQLELYLTVYFVHQHKLFLNFMSSTHLGVFPAAEFHHSFLELALKYIFFELHLA